jgi:hypothetical protein
MNKMITLGLLITTLIGCNSNKEKLKDSITEIDRLLRDDSLKLTETLNQFDLISDALDNSTNRIKDKNLVPEADNYDVKANYKWNKDSSVTVVKSSINVSGFFGHKAHEIKRETIINLYDTALLYSRLHVWFDETRRSPITDSISPGYIFLQEINYLSKKRPIKIWRKFDWKSTSLADTVDFINRPFEDITEVQEGTSFSEELYYARNILTRN